MTLKTIFERQFYFILIWSSSAQIASFQQQQQINFVPKQQFTMNIEQYMLLVGKSPILLPKIKPSNHKSPHKYLLQKRRYNQQIATNADVYKLSSNQIIRGKTTEKSLKTFNKTMRATFMAPSIKLVEEDKRQIGKYRIIKQIGKGGFAKVFQCSDKDGNIYALKQYNLQTGIDCYENQSNVGKKFFGEISNLQKKHSNVQGIQCLIRYIDRLRIGKKGYIVQQLGGSNFSKMVSEIQGVFYNNQRVYQINFKPFYQKLYTQNNLKSIFLQLCQAVYLLNKQGYVHCDIKSQNVLIQNDKIDQKPKVKLIDFGSTFQMSKGVPKITITPQYMPPELLNYLHSDYQNQSRLDKIDVWSLGCILLQVVTGVPLWFKYKCKLSVKGKTILQLGYFSLANRDYLKIMKKQKQLSSYIKNISFANQQFEKYRDILKLTLQYEPNRRINIQDLVKKVRKLQ